MFNSIRHSWVIKTLTSDVRKPAECKCSALFSHRSTSLDQHPWTKVPLGKPRGLAENSQHTVGEKKYFKIPPWCIEESKGARLFTSPPSPLPEGKSTFPAHKFSHRGKSCTPFSRRSYCVLLLSNSSTNFIWIG